MRKLFLRGIVFAFLVNVPVDGADEAVIDMIKEGVMVSPAGQQTAEIGRKYTNRQMPW